MTFDSIILAAIAVELNTTLAGGRVEKVYQPSPLDVVFIIRNGGANHSLLVSSEAASPRIHLTSIKRPNPKTPPNFCMLLRKYLEGARITAFEQMDFDRILKVRFSAYDGEPLTLVVEIMGKHSNIILINDLNRMLGVVKPVGRSKNRYRELLSGRAYISPPPQQKIDPLNISREDFDALFRESFTEETSAQPEEIGKWLVRTFSGISPFAGSEISARTGNNHQRMRFEFFDLIEKVKSGSFQPVLITDDSGKMIGYYPFPSVQFPSLNQHSRRSINSLADMYYTSILPVKAFEHMKEELEGRIRREMDARTAILESLQSGIEEGKNAERYKQLGELILSQTASIPEKAVSVELVDYYDSSGAPVNVALDAQLSPAENAEAYFRKYRKALSSAEAKRDRLSEVETEMKALRNAQDSMPEIVDLEQVKELTADLESQGIITKRQEAVAPEKRKPEFEGYKISRTESGGWEILVGQNSEANDYLLKRLAGPNDVWLHVKAAPSAHVIIRTKGKSEAVPKSVLYAAAELAVRSSPSKHSSLIPIDYTLRKHVRKPRGSEPGKVIYTHEKTIFLSNL